MPKNRTLVALLLACAAGSLAAPEAALAGGQTQPSGKPTADADGDRHPQGASQEPIVVTGSRIRGAAAASETETLSGEAIAAAGQVDLGEAVRALPANFGGGQNPGVGAGAGLVNSNINSASTVNLRGLGPDATLTLLNGHRLPSDAAFGGADISAIPLAAIERIDVVPDGASAIYGSDAVAGVVNVVLRRDFSGIEASTQVGGATEGGYSRQQADLVTGTRWSSGGLVVAYDFTHNAAIRAGQRAYAASLDPAASLYPSLARHAATLSAHEDLGHGVRLSLDVLYARRTSRIVGGTAAARYNFGPEVDTLSAAPSLEIALGGWTAKVVGVLGRDHTHYATSFTPAGGASTLTSGCYCNRTASVEVGGEGPLFPLPGGEARAAFGAGYRDNSLAYTSLTNGVAKAAFDVSRPSHFAYGEINLPFVSPANGVRGIAQLSLAGALRYEDYPGMAHLATPRVGVVYAPVAGLTFRGTWSRSFKAPTLYQEYVPYQAYLLPAVAFGAGAPGKGVVYASGGNPGLKPERARSWTAGVDIRPTIAPALLLSATWFDVRYRDRVVQPIAGSIAAAFRDPGYASLIDFAPTPGELAGLINGAQLGLQNFSGAAFDPAQVVALVDNRNTNVAAQSIHGVDAHLAWRTGLAATSKLTLDVAGTWLESRQRLTATLPSVDLAGSVFNPPHVRIRASGTIEMPRLQVSGAVNYTGALSDLRFATPARVSPFATVDLSGQLALLGNREERRSLSLSVTLSNLLDHRPQQIRTTGPTDTPYDSTNDSPIGRFVAVGVRGRW